MKPFGTQLVAEFSDCQNVALLDHQVGLEQILEAAITEAGLGCLKISSHKFSPIGVTVAAIISESHAAIHTYPEASHASIDIFTCAKSDKTHLVLEYLKKHLQPGSIVCREVNRGTDLYLVDQ